MWKDSIRQARVLVVDDDPACVLELERVLEQGGFSHIVSTTDARQTLPLFRRVRPDVVLLDLQMPHCDGFEVMAQIAAALPPRSHLPILAFCDPAEEPVFSPATLGVWSLHGNDALENGKSHADKSETNGECAWRRRALQAGADDFVVKPLDSDELLLRLNNLLRMRFAHLHLQHQARHLEERVQIRTRDLQEAEFEMLERLALAAEYRDDATGQHTYRVSRTAALLSHAVGLPAARVDLIRRAAPLHDIGKIGIADGILLKKGALSVEERNTMRHHTYIGAKILSGSRSPLLRLAEDIALSHHEHWNGNGYPGGLKGEAIPLAGRIVAIADVFDALSNERPYKKAWELPDVVQEIIKGSGTQFDPTLVEAFATLPHEILLHSDPSPLLSHDNNAPCEPETQDERR